MTRRIRPPKHQVTGHPYIDNELRNDWRSLSKRLRRQGSTAVLVGATTTTIWKLLDLAQPVRVPRKKKKRIRKAASNITIHYPALAWHV